MKKIALLILLLILEKPLWAQDAHSFINQLTGEWSGTLYIYTAAHQLVDSAHADIKIEGRASKALNDYWLWQTTYNSTQYGKIVKDYRLLRDSVQFRYLLDENNGILLPAYLLGNSLTMRYDVSGQWYHVSYRQEQDLLIYEVYYGSSKPISTHENRTEQAVYSITGLEAQGLQRVIFKRKKP